MEGRGAGELHTWDHTRNHNNIVLKWHTLGEIEERRGFFSQDQYVSTRVYLKTFITGRSIRGAEKGLCAP